MKGGAQNQSSYGLDPLGIKDKPKTLHDYYFYKTSIRERENQHKVRKLSVSLTDQYIQVKTETSRQQTYY